ncbi:amidohydrolase family protein [Pleionea sp. CnH1-48]|uniref:amidohydrolase family protein n=1 Tax=Pleionea sp. CnH1-48 TaxID=2954494 RepID=UPI00209761DE|nr:amidohydrolase family protein [Pleionea sp. CnH1-48]MCO7223951.1 amidohydrolase family protein [Pleionea sp. CnH1-48]
MSKATVKTASAAFFALAMSASYGDQTSHHNGIHDRSSSLIAFTNATVTTEPGKTLENATLVIQHGKIVSVKAKGKAPAGARIIDLSNHHVYPGFIDPYSYYSFEEKRSSSGFGGSPKYHGDRTGAKGWNDAIHAEVNWISEFEADPKAAKSYIKNGFTSVQTGTMDGIFRGQATTVSLADGIPNDLIYNAYSRHYLAYNKGSSKQNYPSSLMGSIALIRQSLSDANWYQKAQGKTDALITGTAVETNTALEAMGELKTAGIIFEPENTASLIAADKLLDSFKLSAAFVGRGFEYAHLKDIKNTKSTLVLPLNFPNKPDVSSFEAQQDASLRELRHWERAPANAAILADNDIPFAFTHHKLKKKSDLWPAIKKAIKNGLSEQQALSAITTVPAQLAGIANKAGKIKTGMMADLVIVDGNVFKDGKIKSVWLQGKETSFKPLAKNSLPGQFTLNIDGKELTLKLTAPKNKTQANFLVGEEKVSATVMNAADGHIQLKADLKKVGLEGVYRLTARLQNKQLTGHIVNAQGQRVAFNSEQKPLDSTEEKDKKSADDENKGVEFLGQLTYPNRAFGLNKIPKQEKLHIKNATLWTSEDKGILENADLLIAKGKIKKVGSKLSTPRGYTTIDGTGLHVTAGIIDEHAHIAINMGVNEGSDAITSEVAIGDVINPEDINIYRSMAGGTTIAQLLHGSANPIGGQAQVIKLRWGHNAEQLKFKKAPGSIKFALGENVKQSNWGDNYNIRYPQSRMGVDTIVRDGFERAIEYRDAWEKYDDLSRSAKKQVAPPRKDYRLDALVEILEGKRFVHSHSYVASEILSLMKIADDFDFNIQTFTHILEGYKVADEMVKHGATASTFADWWGYKFEVYDAIAQNACLMHEKGVNVSINSDSNDLMRRLNTEAAKSINYCGMSQEDAWKMVTINPAKQLKIDQWVGSLKAGKDADFVIWDGNPLSIYSKVKQTWIDGRKYFDREEDAQTRLALAKEKNALIQKALGAGKADKSEGKKASASQPVFYMHEAPTWHCEDNFDYWHWQSDQHQGHHH